MSGLLSALNAGKTSMFVNQKQIEITSNNINNVNTPGYSRQKAQLTTYPALDYKGYFVGQGVSISGIEREHDTFLTRQLTNKKAELGEETGRSSPLAELERIFNLNEQNLGTEIQQFFDSWQELTTDPGNQVQRDLVIQRGALLADAFHSTAQEIDTIYENANITLFSQVAALNTKLQQVADLNSEIVAIESTGQMANGFRDQRDLLMEELTYSLGVQSYEEGNGMISVQLPGGLPLVQGEEALTLVGTMVGTTLNLEIQLGGATLPVNQNNLGGEFKGLMDLAADFIPQILGNLDKLAYSLVMAVNGQHQLGTDLDNNPGGFFFDDLTAAGESNASRNIAIDPGLALLGARGVAAGESDGPGDNRNAQKIAQLIDDPIVDAVDTLNDYYSMLTTSVGIESQQNRIHLQGAEDTITQLQNMRDSRVGISLEEEMVNLLQFQQGFEAAAKLLATVDEMLSTLIAIKR